MLTLNWISTPLFKVPRLHRTPLFLQKEISLLLYNAATCLFWKCLSPGAQTQRNHCCDGGSPQGSGCWEEALNLVEKGSIRWASCRRSCVSSVPCRVSEIWLGKRWRMCFRQKEQQVEVRGHAFGNQKRFWVTITLCWNGAAEASKGVTLEQWPLWETSGTFFFSIS